MAQSKRVAHTPTPWECFYGGNFVKIGARGFKAWTRKHHYLGGPLSVLEVHYYQHEDYDSNPEQAIANAQFILRACNNHDALLAALSDLIRLSEHVGKLTGHHVKLDMHKAALAEAQK